MTGGTGSPETRINGDLLNRALPVRVVDVVLAALQHAFGQDDLIDGENPFRFNREDPKNSRVWICDPDGRIDTERDGRRMLVSVTRGDLVPAEAHLHNVAGGNLQGRTELSDLISAPVQIQCEAGSRTTVEALAHACYSVLKLYRRRIMRDYEIADIRIMSLSQPQRTAGIPGDPWVASVVLRVSYQERGTVTEAANNLNYLAIKSAITKHSAERDEAVQAVLPQPVSDSLLNRVMPVRVVDTILAALQAALGQDNLLGDSNPFRFNRADPKNSRVWVCDPDARIDTERDGRRMLVSVTRGDLVPSESHLHNYAGGDLHGRTDVSDLINVPLAIQCEAGSRALVEVLAHICYSVMKLFRRQIMHDYEITALRVVDLSPPQRSADIPGDPWLVTVNLRCAYQERGTITEAANNLNYLVLNAAIPAHRAAANLPAPPDVRPGLPVPATNDSLLNRIMPVRAVDTILAVLQMAFGQDNLMGESNPFRFHRNDPKNSRVWICDPDGRVDTPRDGRRMLITVQRGDLVPAEAHLYNYAGGDMHGTDDVSDLTTAQIYVQCEAGNRTSVEVLVHACYSVIKMFRRQILRDYDILNLRVSGITPAQRTEGIPGDPWLCVLLLQCEYQERAR